MTEPPRNIEITCERCSHEWLREIPERAEIGPYRHVAADPDRQDEHARAIIQRNPSNTTYEVVRCPLCGCDTHRLRSPEADG